jgi:hypothetical protein
MSSTIETMEFEEGSFAHTNIPKYKRWKYIIYSCIVFLITFPFGIYIGTLINIHENIQSSFWIEGKTWIFHIQTQNISTPVEFTIVKSYEETGQILATSSSWIALQHAFEDHIPFLGRIKRVNFEFYENGIVQTLNMPDKQWSSNCFDTPFTMNRIDDNSVTGISVNQDSRIKIEYDNTDNFIDKLEYSAPNKEIHMNRLVTYSTPSNPRQNFWFARSTPIASIQHCKRGSYIVPNKASERNMIVMRIKQPINTLTSFLYNTKNWTIDSSGIFWFPLSIGDFTINSCSVNTVIDIIGVDMYKWNNVLAQPHIVVEW